MFWNKFGKSNLNIFCIFCQLFLAWFCFRKKYLSFFVFVTNCINTWTFLLCLTNLLFVYRICMIPRACHIYYYLKLVSKNKCVNYWFYCSTDSVSCKTGVSLVILSQVLMQEEFRTNLVRSDFYIEIHTDRLDKCFYQVKSQYIHIWYILISKL